jgi:Transposase DDE domain
MRYQVLRIAIPRKGRALPLLQLAYDRDNLPVTKSQNQLEQDALLAIVKALPRSVRPMVLADRGFRRAGFIAWLERHSLDYIVRLSKGSCITDTSGHQWKLGEERLKPGQLRFAKGVRYGGFTTGVPEICGLMWPYAGRCRRVEHRGTSAEARRGPRSPGTWPRVSKRQKARPVGTGKGAG